MAALTAFKRRNGGINSVQWKIGIVNGVLTKKLWFHLHLKAKTAFNSVLWENGGVNIIYPKKKHYSVYRKNGRATGFQTEKLRR